MITGVIVGLIALAILRVIVGLIALAILLGLPTWFSKPKRVCSLCYGAGRGQSPEGEDIRCILCSGRGWI